MLIKQHPIIGLWCREDGAILMPPTYKFPKHRWVFGTEHHGYRTIRYNHVFYRVHRLICEAFRGPAPANKPFVDHINGMRHDNNVNNLRWASAKENIDNRRFKKDAILQQVDELKYQLRIAQNNTRHERLHRCIGLAAICEIKQRCAITISRREHFCDRRDKLLAYANSLKTESAG